jgi:hypothetical protein
MKILDWLEENAEKVVSPLDSDSMIWITKSRGDYITIVGMEDKEHLPMERLGVTDFVSSTWKAGSPINIGFNPDEEKWYGWSHRAIYGFGVGSVCERGHIHYRPVDKDDFLEDMIHFWSDDTRLNVRGEHQKDGVYVEWETSQAVANESMRGEITGCHSAYPDEYGRGEWVAETMSDARQMAIDFASNIA